MAAPRFLSRRFVISYDIWYPAVVQSRQQNINLCIPLLRSFFLLFGYRPRIAQFYCTDTLFIPLYFPDLSSSALFSPLAEKLSFVRMNKYILQLSKFDIFTSGVLYRVLASLGNGSRPKQKLILLSKILSER